MIDMIIDDKDNNDDHKYDQNYDEDDKDLRPMSVRPGALIIKGDLAATFHDNFSNICFGRFWNICSVTFQTLVLGRFWNICSINFPKIFV